MGTRFPQVFNPKKPGAVQGTRLPSTSHAPACRRPAHPRLRPSPAPGTRAPAGGERAGEASVSRVRAGWGRGGVEAILSSDPDSVPASRAGAEGGERLPDGGKGDGARGGKPKTQRPWVLSLALGRCPSFSGALGRRSRDSSESTPFPFALSAPFHLPFSSPPPLPSRTSCSFPLAAARCGRLSATPGGSRSTFRRQTLYILRLPFVLS